MTRLPLQGSERAPKKGTPEYNHASYLRKNGRAGRHCVDCGTPVVYSATRCQLCAIRNVVVPNRKQRSDAWTPEMIVEALRAWAATHGGDPPTVVEADKPGRTLPSKSVVARNFGSWNAGIEAAGLEPRRRGETRRATNSEKAEGPRVRNRQMVRAGAKGATSVYHGASTARDHKVP